MHPSPLRTLVLCLAVLILNPAAPAQEHDRAGGAPEADREAILSMAGAFRVTFRFEETLGIDPDYELTEPYTESALELVEVIEDRGGFISLQHVLVVERSDGSTGVVKHWRQDWTYEDADVLAFQGRSTWARDRRNTDEVDGTWTQAVYQTTDAPRYEAVGRWEHLGERSSWESEITWRPLPRRERTKRDDYHVVVCRNRHTVTPAGWVHEQDNQKVVLNSSGEPERVIAHETGLNSYERVDRALLEPAAAYWRQHADAWREVREAWSDVLSLERFTLEKTADGTPIHRVIYPAIEDAGARAGLADKLLAYVR